MPSLPVPQEIGATERKGVAPKDVEKPGGNEKVPDGTQRQTDIDHPKDQQFLTIQEDEDESVCHNIFLVSISSKICASFPPRYSSG